MRRLEEMQRTAASVPSEAPQLASASALDGFEKQGHLPQLQRNVEFELDEGKGSPFSDDSPTYGSPLTVGNVTFSGATALDICSRGALCLCCFYTVGQLVAQCNIFRA